MNQGWIKLHRSLVDHWVFTDPVKLKWWITILLTVNYEDKKVLIGSNLVTCKRGESLMSLRQWALKLLTTPKTVRRFFVLLENDGMITTQNVNFSTHLKVCNYEGYQDQVNTLSTLSPHLVHTLSTLSPQLLPTTKEEEEEKKNNTKKEKKNIYGENFEINLKAIKQHYREEWVRAGAVDAYYQEHITKIIKEIEDRQLDRVAAMQDHVRVEDLQKWLKYCNITDIIDEMIAIDNYTPKKPYKSFRSTLNNWVKKYER